MPGFVEGIDLIEDWEDVLTASESEKSEQILYHTKLVKITVLRGTILKLSSTDEKGEIKRVKFLSLNDFSELGS
jgi:hypothetical protein